MLRHKIAIAPMRVQPFHFGHAYFLHQLVLFAEEVIVLLNRKLDTDNPFSFFIRQKWMRTYCREHGLHTVRIPDRIALDKRNEYETQARHEPFVVVTTDETDRFYTQLGFQTHNHHRTGLPVPANADYLDGAGLPIADTGRIVRDRLRKGLSCTALLAPRVEQEASKLIRNP